MLRKTESDSYLEIVKRATSAHRPEVLTIPQGYGHKKESSASSHESQNPDYSAVAASSQMGSPKTL